MTNAFEMNNHDMLLLSGMYLAPYMQLATALIGKSRHSGGNMFRHQIDTMAILIDYGYIDSVLLKASIVHDLIEDIPDFNRNLLMNVDSESSQVYELVMEMSRPEGVSKRDYLLRIARQGSINAKILKCADRISNMISLGFVTERSFIKRYCDETEELVIPIAKDINTAMYAELKNLVASRRKYLAEMLSLDEKESRTENSAGRS